METTYPLTIYYESECPMCDAEMTNLRLRDSRGLLRFVDVCATDFEGPPPGATREDLLEAIHGRTANGTVIRGMEVFRLAYSAIGLGAWAGITRWPLLRPLCDRLYRALARRRHRVPRVLVRLALETVVRRAAERAAQRARCDTNTCRTH